MEENHPYREAIVNDSRYKDGPTSEQFPHFESLKLTIDRTIPYWNDVIVPQIRGGKKIVIAVLPQDLGRNSTLNK
jgi:bisphosphoglycerate-dependent phosphoglycerate mutase